MGSRAVGACAKGWNDGCDEQLAKEYSTNMPNFIRDIRKEFVDLPQDKSKPKLPFSIGASGMGGYTNPTNLLAKYVIPAQVRWRGASMCDCQNAMHAGVELDFLRCISTLVC